jgi:hypothetical protein
LLDFSIFPLFFLWQKVIRLVAKHECKVIDDACHAGRKAETSSTDQNDRNSDCLWWQSV